MAAAPIKVEQALHGYARGHRELACSVDLDRDSIAQMLALSDLLVTPVGGSNTSYLAAYPLKHAKRFVLAKTWLAEKASRPGSVWTHSLILELSALTVIANLEELVGLLRFPEGADFEGYAQSLKFHPNTKIKLRRQWDAGADPRARAALARLYGSDPASVIVLPSSSEHDGDLAIALWSQMWPAMRRNFAFVSGPVRRLTNFDAACALYFQQGGPEPESGSPTDPHLERGIDLLCQDLGATGPTELRSFIGRYAIEASEPRSLVLPLAIHSTDHVRLTVREKLRSISDLGEVSRLPRLVSDTIVNGLIDAEYVDDVVALLETYRDAPAPKSLGEGVGQLGKRKDIDLPRILCASRPSEEGKFGQFLFSSLVGTAAPSQLVDAANRGIEREVLLELRPELWDVEAFWPASDAGRAEFAKQSGRTLSLAEALKLFPGAIGPQVLAILLEDKHKSTDMLLELLGRLEARALETAADYVVADPAWINALAQLSPRIGPDILEELCNAVVRAGGLRGEAEAWVNLALARLQSTSSRSRSVQVVAFVAALGVPPNKSLALAEIIYDTLVKAARSYALSRPQEQFLMHAIPGSVQRRNLQRSLAAAVVSKWHADAINPRALGLSSDREALEDIVAELVSKFGHNKVEAMIAKQDLAPALREKLRRVYRPKPKKRKQSFLWWDW